MDKKIKVNGLYKTDIFKNINFTLEHGVLCVLSKKPERSSALLDTLVGVKAASGGEIIGSENAVYISVGAPLPRYLTAKEYLNFVLKIKNEAALPEKALAITEEFREKTLETLSPLERLSLSAAASLVGNPSAIVWEEPYRDLSFDEYSDFKRLIISVSEEAPFIFSSSSVFECKEISDKTLVLSAGSQIYFGETKALFETDINETDVCCLVKGDRDMIAAALERYSPETEETVREGIYLVTVKCVPMFRAAETRSRIKKLLSKARLSLLEIKSEKEALFNIIGELSENDRKKRDEYEESVPVKAEKLTRSLISFSHDEESEEENDCEDGEDGDIIIEEGEELYDGAIFSEND